MASDDLIRSGQTITEANFRGQMFEGRVDFSGCVFTGKVDFGGCVFKGVPDFSRAVFQDRVYFRGSVFEAGVNFYEAVFERYATFKDVTVTGLARFTAARFEDAPTLEGLTVEGELRFDRANFEIANLVGPLRATELDLRVAVFRRRVRMEIEAAFIRCERTLFEGGVQLLAGRADIVMKDCELGPASLVGSRHLHGRSRPRLVTLSGTDVSNLTVSSADLSACKFIYAYNLDKLRVDSSGAFGPAPRSLWIGRREVIGDELRWRAAHRRESRWRPPDAWPRINAPDSASRVGSAYQALRRGREDVRDEPGAVDFYFGEMEMRRLGTRRLMRERRGVRGRLTAWGEYLLLTLYWLTSGYGLRASRAFLSLVVLVAVAALGFDLWGFPPKSPDMSYADSVRFTLRTATSFLRGSDQKLSTTGEWIELALRFTGPVLFGLFVFALRSRIKR